MGKIQDQGVAAVIPTATEKRITTLLALEKGWNGYNARPIQKYATDRARPFIAALHAWGMAPWLTPLSCGGVAIERAETDDYTVEIATNGNITVSIEFHRDGARAAMAVLAAAEPFLRHYAPEPDPQGKTHDQA